MPGVVATFFCVWIVLSIMPVPAADRGVNAAPAAVETRSALLTPEAIAIMIMLLAGGSGLGVAFAVRRMRVLIRREREAAGHERRVLVKHLEYISKYANEVMLLFDQDWRIVECNERVLDFLGYTREELLRLTAFDIRPASRRNDIMQWAIVLTEQDRICAETELLRKDGTLFPVEASDRIIIMDGRRYYQSMVRDISQQRRIGNLLHHRFRDLAELLPQAVMETDAHGHITYGNRQLGTLFGVQDHASMIGASIFGFVPDVQRSIVMRLFLRVLHGGVLPENEILLRRVDGVLFPALVFASAITSEGEHVGVRAVIVDFSQMKEAENALRQSEHRFRGVTDATASAIWILHDDRFVFVNAECIRLTGYSREELCAMTIWDLVHPDHHGIYRRPDAVDDGSAPVQERTEYRIVTRAGAVRWLDVIGSCIEFDGRKADLATAIDITDKKRTEERLNQLVQAFLDYSNEPIANINRLLTLCRESTRADAAFYNVISNGTIRTIASCHAPSSFVGIDHADGHICTEIIRTASTAPVVIRHLPSTEFAQSDPNVLRHGLQTYIGLVVPGNAANGVLNVVFTEDFIPTQDDLNLLHLVAIAVGIEAKRKHAEEAVRQSDDRYRAFINATDDLVSLKDAQLRYVICNESAARLFERPIQDVIGKTDTDMLTSDSAARARAADLDMLAQGRTMLSIDRFQDRLFEATRFPVPIGDDATGVGTIIRDITERTLADARLQESRRMLANLMSNLQGMAYRRMHDDAMTILFVSEGCTTLTGYEPSDLIDNAAVSFRTLVDHNDVHALQRAIDRAIETGHPYQITYRLSTKGDRVCWVWEKGIPVFDPHGSLLYTEGLIADITAQRLAEDALLELSETLQKVIASSPVAIVVANRDGNVTLWNPAAERVFGWTTQEALGKPAHLMPPEVTEGAQSLFGELLRGDSASNLETQRQRKDGTALDVHLSSAPLRDADGRITSVMMMYADITERKRADRALLDSAKGYEQLFNGIEDAIYILDEESVFLDVNAGAMRSDGFPLDTYVGRSITELSAADRHNARALRDLIRQAFHGTVQRFEWWSITASGRIVPKDVLLTAGLYHGQPAVIAIGRDVTEQKQAELLQNAMYSISEAVHTTHNIDQLYRSVHGTIARVMDAQNFYIALYDEQEDILTFPYHVDQEDNKAPVMRPGKSLTAYVLQTGASLLCTAETFRTLVEAGSVELVGEWSPIWLGVPLKVEDKTIGVMVVQHYTNENAYGEREQRMLEYVSSQIAEAILKKRAEERLKMLAQAIMNTSECVTITDLENNLLFVNEAFCDTYGYQEADVIGKPMTLFRPDSVGNDIDMEIVHATLDGGWRGELRNRRKDGSEFPVILGTSVVRDDTGRPIAMIGVAKDITEWKRQERELITAKEMAEQSERLKDAFIANMSHEIRTPLNIIMGYSTLFASQFQDRMRPEEMEFFQSIERAGARLMRTVELILNISSIQAGSFHERQECVDLVQHVRSLIGDYQSVAAEKQLSLEFHTSSPVIQIMVDPYALDQACSNIIDNAIKFTHQGSVRVRVSVEKQFGCVSVQDTGIGISSDFLPRIFKSFTQEAAGYARPYEGLGLGLALTKAYVERNQGAIAVHSERGRGTHVAIRFRLFEGSEAGHAEGIQHIEAVAASSTPTLPSVLVVEDDMETQTYMRYLLSKKYHVRMTASSDEALQLIGNEHFDVVLMDLSLPGTMDGLALTREIRTQFANLDLPVIAITGHAFPRDKERCLEAGCNAYLSKPFQNDQLETLLTSMIVSGY
jgi:PAS domain S-box-containing protein